MLKGLELFKTRTVLAEHNGAVTEPFASTDSIQWSLLDVYFAHQLGSWEVFGENVFLIRKPQVWLLKF